MALRVFMVEDADNMLSLMKELCLALGEMEIVGTSGTEAEAIDWLEQNRGGWDVAVLDLVLSQGSGINLVSRARTTHRTGQIAVFSGYATPGVEEHCKRLGADAVFDKRDTQRFVEWLELLRLKASGPSSV
jgi:DNA-binding NarL/FixJ family response regulator